MEFSDKNSLILEEWRNLRKEYGILEIEKAIALTKKLDTNEIISKIEKKNEEIDNKAKEYNKNDQELIKVRQKAEKEFDSIFRNDNQGKSFRDIIHENIEKIFKPNGTIDSGELKIEKIIETFINKQCPEYFLGTSRSSLEAFSDGNLLDKFSNKELIYKYMIIIEKIKNKSEEERSPEEKEISSFIKNLEQNGNANIDYIKDLTDKLDVYIELKKQKVQELNLDFDGKLLELERAVNSLSHTDPDEQYYKCFLEYHKTKVELEKEENEEDSKDRLKITFCEKKINLLEKHLEYLEYNYLVKKMSYSWENEIKLEKSDIYERLRIENEYQSRNVKDTRAGINSEIEFLQFDYNICDELIKIRDLSSNSQVTEEEINQHRQYLDNNRKLYLELKKKLEENHISQTTIINSNSNLQQRRYKLAKMKHQQRMLSTKKEKLTNLIQNKIKKPPQSFAKKHNLRRSNSQPNLSFLEREELKKQKRAAQLLEFS